MDFAARFSAWLCPTEFDRSRVVEANDRVRMIRRVGSIAVAVALVTSAPWVGWWTLLLLGASALNFVNVDRRMRTSPRPEIISIMGNVITLGLLGGGVAYSGGPRSPVIGWLVFPAAMLAARFRPQVVVASLAVSVSVILAVTLGVDPRWTLANPVPVFAALTLLVVVVSIVWALQAAELFHRGEAILDQLTGLLNRNSLLPRFDELTQQARLTHSPISLVLCDLDHFKEINDTHGHDVGDAVLRDVAYELRKGLRSFELIYRLGGEEFLIVMPGITIDGSEEIAERLRSSLEKARLGGVDVTISAGVSAGSGDDVDYDTLFRAADAALYEAKRAGRNRVVTAERRRSEAHGRRKGDDEPAVPAKVEVAGAEAAAPDASTAAAGHQAAVVLEFPQIASGA